MGNKISEPASRASGVPIDELRLKTGDKLEPIAYPLVTSVSSYDKLFSNSNFKDFLLSNLDNNNFICSIIQNSHDNTIVLNGIEYFQNMNPEKQEETINKMTKIRNFTTAGINVINYISIINFYVLIIYYIYRLICMIH
jgi:hypothetical protein